MGVTLAPDLPITRQCLYLLPSHHRCKEARHLGKLFEGAYLINAPALHHDDLVSVMDRAQAMCNRNPGDLTAVQTVRDNRLGPVVQSTGRLVQEENPRVFH